MKARIVRGLVFGLLCAGAFSAFPDRQYQDQVDPQLRRPRSVRELLHFASFVPETEESFVHIGGGFFAYFNRREGKAEESSELCLPDFDRLSHTQNGGQIRFSLQELGYESRLVYRPEGSLVLKTAEGGTLRFKMEILDYVQISGSELPCYRLTAGSGQGLFSKAILICRAVGTEAPRLVGTIYLVTGSGEDISSYGIEIGGRNNAEAENHLWKVVEVASHF